MEYLTTFTTKMTQMQVYKYSIHRASGYGINGPFISIEIVNLPIENGDVHSFSIANC
jgi:hypothetical protein